MDDRNLPVPTRWGDQEGIERIALVGGEGTQHTPRSVVSEALTEKGGSAVVE